MPRIPQKVSTTSPRFKSRSIIITTVIYIGQKSLDLKKSIKVFFISIIICAALLKQLIKQII